MFSSTKLAPATSRFPRVDGAGGTAGVGLPVVASPSHAARVRLPLATLLGVAAMAFGAAAHAQTKPVTTCDAAGIGAAKLTADKPPKILEAAPATAGKDATAVPYCLVKVLVPDAINIWVGLPMDGKWNGKLQSIGGGGYAGTVGPPAAAVQGGYIGITTDTGHKGSDGTFGMKSPGVAN
jgi:hypothetical protein